MAHVKTAMEVALEKAALISVSKAEKAAFQQKERFIKAKEVVNQFLNGKLKARGLVDWQQENADESDDRRLVLAVNFTRLIAQKNRLDQVLEGLSTLGLLHPERIKQQILEIMAKRDKQFAVNSKQMAAQYLRKLMARGIQGSAVVPKVPEHPAAEVSDEADPETMQLLATIQRWCLQAMGIKPETAEALAAFD